MSAESALWEMRSHGANHFRRFANDDPRLAYFVDHPVSKRTVLTAEYCYNTMLDLESWGWIEAVGTALPYWIVYEITLAGACAVEEWAGSMLSPGRVGRRRPAVASSGGGRERRNLPNQSCLCFLAVGVLLSSPKGLALKRPPTCRVPAIWDL